MKHMIELERRFFLLALGFFTRIPVPSMPDFKEQELNAAVKYFPLIGILVGSVAAGAYWATSFILPKEIAVILSMMATIYLTGCFHEDGLADAVDGLGGGWSKEQALTIMQDSRIGSYGATALIIALLLKFTVLSNLSPTLLPWVLITGHSISRYSALLVMVTQSYVRGVGKAKPLATTLTVSNLVFASVIGLLPLSVFVTKTSPEFLLCLLPVGVIWWWFSAKLRKRIGGYTGDCLGAMQQLTEIAFYLAMLACSKWLGLQ